MIVVKSFLILSLGVFLSNGKFVKNNQVKFKSVHQFKICAKRNNLFSMITSFDSKRKKIALISK